MNLAARRSARLKERLVMRLGSILVSFSMAASMMVATAPKAKAVVPAVASVPPLAAAFMDAMGLTPVVTGMTGTSDVNEALARLIQDYLGTIGAPTVEEWLGKEIGLIVSGGKVIIPRPVSKKLGEFAVWVGEKFKTGLSTIYSGYSAPLVDGGYFSMSVPAGSTSYFGPIIGPMTFKNGYSVGYVGNNSYAVLYAPDGSEVFRSGYYVMGLDHVAGSIGFTLDHDSSGKPLLAFYYSDPLHDIFRIDSHAAAEATYTFLAAMNVGDFALDISDQWQDALDRIASLEEQQTIALDVGATDSMTIQEILQNILEAILAGNLAAAAEVVDTAEIPEEPEQPVVPVVPSDLDALGAALTSRFPFSIPWDIYKAVKLLAAPAKAPYWEVDLLAPIAHRVGGWKGSTRIVLDFSEYEVIGQVCRWASTIGFCMMLASGTKRLIWTA